MTSGVGHPDWQTYSNWRGPVLYNAGIVVPGGGSLTIGTWPVAHFASVYVELINQTGGCNVQARYGEAANAIRPSVVHLWNVEGNSQLSALIPALGNFVQLSATSAGVAGYTANGLVIPTNTAVDRVQYPAVGDWVAADTETVNAGATNRHDLGWVMEGEGWLFVDTLGSASGITVTIWARNPDGTVKFPVYRAFNVTAIINQEWTALNYPLSLEITNNGAGAQNVSYACGIRSGN